MLQRLKLLFDRLWAALACPGGVHYVSGAQSLPPPLTPCLLYTSDAADE